MSTTHAKKSAASAKTITKTGAMKMPSRKKTRRLHAIGIVGATGAVGRKFLTVLAEQGLEPANLRLFASARSAGSKMAYCGKQYTVENLETADFRGLDVVFFSAGTDLSKLHAPRAVKAGAVVIDNSNAFRMDKNVPLVVPEVNAHALAKHRGLIANPNCSTIQMVIALAPIHKVNRIKRVVVTTFQSVSGTGLEAIEILEKQAAARLAGKPLPKGVYEHPIGFNLFPHIDKYQPDGLYLEETKMVLETQKIMGAKIPVCPTTVRVPVFYCHSEAVNLALSKPMTADRVRKLLAKAPGVVVCDEPARAKYPTPLLAQDTDDVYVGRIRNDPSQKYGINLFVVADNLRVGAATNAVRIYQEMCRQGLL